MPVSALIPFGQVDSASAVQRLADSHAQMQVAGLYGKWKRDNPHEAALIEAYWADGTLPVPLPATAFGKAYVDEAEAFHFARGTHG